VRIIAGTLKGRRLRTPDWEGVRPTSDRLRETLFNVLGPAVEGASFVDAYAGTGAVGIEALSRGARQVTFVEQDPRALRLIGANLAHCGVTERYAIIRAGFAGAVRQLAGEAPDLVFLDPPYGREGLRQALEGAAALASPSTIVVVEHATRDRAPEQAGTLIRTRELKSGDSALAFYRRAQPRGSA
jgi:16S rRNA (guanine(966)-N(2))-methyltransferase RsmD